MSGEGESCDSLTNKFVLIETQNLKPLLKVLENRLPKSANVYNCILRQSRHPSEFSTYTINANTSSTSWILVVQFQDGLNNPQQIHISAPANPSITDEIKSAFMSSDAIHWDQGMMFNAVDRFISPMIMEISWLHYRRVTTCYPGYQFVINIEDAMKMKQEIPSIKSESVQLKSLDMIDGASFIQSACKRPELFSLQYVKEMIGRHPSFGVYVNGKPVSAVLTHSYLLVGLLSTDPNYRNKGYATHCFKSLIVKLAEEGYIPTSSAEQTNTASIKFHEKCGMSVSHECDYIESFSSN